ncbi:MAG: rare lipoprotein A [Enterobacterales bacterium]|jgi:rare lipoprotein A
MIFRLSIISVLLLLAACSTRVVQDSGPSSSIDVSGISNAIPREEPLSRGGNPSSYVVFGKRYYVLQSAEGFKEKGVASWYGNKFHGNKTSNGEIYDMYAMTAAHKSLPLPSYVKVTNLNNKRSVIVRVNDRGPFHKGRIIDLSYVAAAKLGIDKVGTAPVEVVTIKAGELHPTLTASHKGESVAVQIGAFSTRGNAEKLKNKLAKLVNTQVRVSEVNNKGQKLYRVRLGPFDDVNTARKWILKLKKMSFNRASLVYLN